MYRLLFVLLFLSSLVEGSVDLGVCKSCHPTIVAEFQSSMHSRSSIKKDKVHNAIWQLHPLRKKGQYKCAKCHTPNNKSHKSMTCLSCHTIKSIEDHKKSNKNIYEKKEKLFYSAQNDKRDQKVVYHEKSSWFGLVKSVEGSPYHDIDYTNKIFYNGKVCMGCHSHKQNSHGLYVCKIKDKGAKDEKNNCITCHMPKTKGSATTIRESSTHAYHGFAGARVSHKLLSKYVQLSMQKQNDGFTITIENKAPHELLTHPLRVLKLRCNLLRDGKTTHLKTHTFVKVLGKDGKPAMPWIADEIIKNSMIKSDEKREVSYKQRLKNGDEVEVILGYYIVKPKAIKKLNLENEKELQEFKVIKRAVFH